ncbi:MAG: GNAT family N-acetyltransferase [Oscillospiraceae bacterium]|nr:GNAT family N-acetyltransferase [Oscillospiraceae bacterium]
MIKQIFEVVSDDVTDSYYGRKILAAYYAYGGNYDFCRFYSCGNGIIHIYNTSMVIDGNIDCDETEMFINMTKPVTVEIDNKMLLQLDRQYQAKHRTLFHVKSGKTDINISRVKVNSCIKNCFKILNECFDNMLSYDDWYVDISHRIRHNVSKLYLYEGTTVTQQFNINGFIFLSHIATVRAKRGRGTARKLLRLIGREAEEHSENAYLFALDHRRSFYETIGFEPIGEDILYEMKG